MPSAPLAMSKTLYWYCCSKIVVQLQKWCVLVVGGLEPYNYRLSGTVEIVVALKWRCA
jgi:hypothetical protein